MGEHVVPAGWLRFRELPESEGRGIHGSYGSTNGGMRDAIGAWPMAKYHAYNADGTYCKSEIALPPSMVYLMRKPTCYGMPTMTRAQLDGMPDEVLAPALVEMLEWRDLPVEGTVAELKARLLAAQASEDDTDDEE
mmetsp:Transcript_35294/g.109377  ORF Transcript_35294/g.109377 Transcript_35294/m.109377 type:complete len:136 (-) Transcript_35294:137-544(-)